MPKSPVLYEDVAEALILSEEELVSAILEEGGVGPLLMGVGAVNRPYIKFMRPLEVVYHEGKEWIKAQIVRFGVYSHPLGPEGKLPFTRKFWQKVIDNFKSNVYGQKVFLDRGHKPNEGSLGEVQRLEESGNGVDAWINPTEAGLAAVRGRDVNYASIDLAFNYQGNEVAIAASESPELEEVDMAQEVFAILAEQAQIDSQEGTMSGNGAETQPETPEGVRLPEDVTEIKAEIAEMQSQIKAANLQLEEERAAFQKERAQQREELRQEKVRVFLNELGQPNDEGAKLDKRSLEVIGSLLLCEPVVVTDEYSIQLSEEVSLGSVHAYYREGLEELARAIPRVVPTGAKVEPKDNKPPVDATLSAERARKRAAIILAKETDSGVKLTAEGLAEIDAGLDRIYGEVK